MLSSLSQRVRRDRDHNIGHLSCRVCTESFQTPIHCTSSPLLFLSLSLTHTHSHSRVWLSLADLSAPIDVYTDWIDECESLNA